MKTLYVSAGRKGLINNLASPPLTCGHVASFSNSFLLFETFPIFINTFTFTTPKSKGITLCINAFKYLYDIHSFLGASTNNPLCTTNFK